MLRSARSGRLAPGKMCCIYISRFLVRYMYICRCIQTYTPTYVGVYRRICLTSYILNIFVLLHIHSKYCVYFLCGCILTYLSYFIYICIYICIHLYICICIYIHMYLHICIHLYMYMYLYIYKCRRVHIHSMSSGHIRMNIHMQILIPILIH